ncbi:hypothetical protein [Thiomicrospira microaerophila]|uniref:hypothetical protein n=1 Tax=Thiomicrospira microaerophila TaxID=406020 RepID=UPI0005C99D95|nr:hypothetical protein [Thiomicrospira microaerophila]
MTIKTALLSFIFALTLLGSQTIQVVHDAVHPFHAHLVDKDHRFEAHPHDHTPSAHAHSIEAWLCDLFDAFSHSKAAVANYFNLDLIPDLQPGLVVFSGFLAVFYRYYPFQSRAPPLTFSV